MDVTFEAWFEEKTGRSLEAMRREAFYAGDARRMRAVSKMEDDYRRLYGYWLLEVEDWNAYREHPEINTFVKAYSGHTFGELHDLALATGSYRDYEKMCEWYRYRYGLLHKNPFLKGEDIDNEIRKQCRMREHPEMEEKKHDE